MLHPVCAALTKKGRGKECSFCTRSLFIFSPSLFLLLCHNKSDLLPLSLMWCFNEKKSHFFSFLLALPSCQSSKLLITPSPSLPELKQGLNDHHVNMAVRFCLTEKLLLQSSNFCSYSKKTCISTHCYKHKSCINR